MPALSLFAAVLLGALLAACALPFAWSAVTPVPLALLFALVASAVSPRAAAWRAFLAGVTFFALHLLWLPESFQVGFGPFGALMFLPVYAIEGSFWAALAWLAVRVGARFGGRVWLLAFGWVLLEWLRHLGPLAFPWGTVGYTLLPLPVAQVADVGGVLLLSLLVTAAAAALATLPSAGPRALLVVASLWGAATAYGVTRPALDGNPGRMLLLRTDVNSFEKASGSGLGKLLEQHRTLTAQAAPDEVPVWSETAVAGYASSIGSSLPKRPMLTGVALFEPDGRFTNSAVSWDRRVLSRYDKSKLVPFGEYSPLAVPLEPVYAFVYGRFLGQPFMPPLPGGAREPLRLGGRSYGTYICYDSVFGQVTAALARGGAGVLVNVSNDGYFGQSVGVEQHFQMGRLRAIETRRFVVRSVNGGIAAVVDPRGRVVRRFDGPGTGVLHARVDFLSGVTLYVRFGDWPIVLVCLAGALFTRLREQRALLRVF